MIPKTLTEAWQAVAPAVGDHLWQSTVFAIAAGMLALILRRNQARARYWVWLAASLKFLLPFSLLVAVGSHATWSHTAGMAGGFYTVVGQVSQPFGQTATISPAAAHPASSSAWPRLMHLLPGLASGLWLGGFLAVLCLWWARWRRISASVHRAVPLQQGREVTALRRVERAAGIKEHTEILASTTSLEPGIFGIRRPVLLWPRGISEHLSDEHLEAILAHEVRHVQRRDNLASALHMMVEAIFWFHPLVWWVGARLVDERERACDEEVLEQGSRRQIYAESILKTCQFCVGSALPCVSGVTGSDLKKRIVEIMTQRGARRLGIQKKLLLAGAAAVAVIGPIVFGLLHAAPVRAQSPAESAAGTKFTYEVASVKPEKSGDERFRIMNTPDGFEASTTLKMMIRVAYDVEDNQITGEPKWVDSDRFSVQAKMDKATADEVRKIADEQMQPVRQEMLRALLADRFKLVTHRETKEQPVYVLVVAKGGSKLKEAKADDPDPNGLTGPDGKPASRGHFVRMGRGQLTGHSLNITFLTHLLSGQLGRTVIDKTGLTGNYSFVLQWTPDQSTAAFNGPGGGGGNSPAPAESGPSIFTAIQEQLGLKLESEKGPVDIIVVDHVEQPSEN